MSLSFAIGVFGRSLRLRGALTKRLHVPLAMAAAQNAVEPFSTSSRRLKKRRVLAPIANNGPSDKEAQDNTPTAEQQATEALDPEQVRLLFKQCGQRFTQEMQTTVTGGRFNPLTLGALRVTLSNKQTAPLSELAEIVPRGGRTVSLLLHDAAYAHPIMSAIQSSKQYNQQPQRVPDNELELILKIELERKEDVVRRIKQTAQAWRQEVRNKRHGHEKKIKEWQRTRVLLADDVRRGDKMMQKVQDETMKEIDGHEAKCIKQLER